jgi:hypothetical protein
MLALVVAGLVALVPAARALSARTRAATAADAAALAGATGGEAAARRLAGANGARLEAFRSEGDQVIVRVRVAGVPAVARAGRRLSVAPCGRARCRSGGSVP